MKEQMLSGISAHGIAAERGRDGAERLAAVTEKVKGRLDLNTGRYKNFDGQLTEGELAPTWRLSWSGEDGSLEITALESGRILSYYAYSGDDSQNSALLALPRRDPARAKAAAAAFLERILDTYETVDLDTAADRTVSPRQTTYYFRGTVFLNGYPSPLNFSLTVGTPYYTVVQFHRDTLETGYLGSLPAAGFRMGVDEVEPLLRSTLSMRLEYVPEEGEARAILRYLPNAGDDFYVDDASGDLVDLTRLNKDLGEGGAAKQEAYANRAMIASDADGGLTQAEQLGADKLKGTLSGETLDREARAVAHLGLDSYALTSASYREEKFEQGAPAIAAILSYAKRGENGICHRIVTLDAKTGALIRVYSSRPQSTGSGETMSEDDARRTAEAFLASRQGERFALCAAYGGDTACAEKNDRYGTWSFRYARQEKGYFFPHDQFNVEIDAVDGFVSGYAQMWSEKMSFDSPDRLIPADQAVSAYLKTFQIVKGYVAVPQKLDLSGPKCASLGEIRYRVLNSLKLGWRLASSQKSVGGIDAKTGQPILREDQAVGTVQYSDLTGSRAGHAAGTLAKYGIGYAGGVFRPDKQLTQLDLVALLASSRGSLIDPDNLTEGDAAGVYRTAYSMGVLHREERDDGRFLSRMDVIKYLLDAGGYGPAARLQGIYRTDFSGAEEVPENLLGYAVLARALNVTGGDSNGQISLRQSATRADAAIMLLAFMQRD